MKRIMKESIDKSKEELIKEVDSLKSELSNLKSSILQCDKQIYEHIFKHFGIGIIIFETKDDGRSFIVKDFNAKHNFMNDKNIDAYVSLSIGDVFYRMTQTKEGLKLLRKVWITGVGIDFVNSIQHKNKVYYTENHFIKLPTGEVVYTYKDITGEKENELALKESKEKYKSLFSSMLNGFGYFRIIQDDNGKPIDYIFIEINPSLEEITGLDKALVIGKKATEVHPYFKKHNRDWIEFYSDVAYNGIEKRFEQYFPADRKWYSIYVFSPRKGYFATIFEDITEEKKAEKALKESEETYRQMFEENNAVMILVEPLTGDIVRANSSASRFYGYSIQELERMNIKELLAMTDQEIQDEMSRNSIKIPNQHRFKHRLASGDIRYVESISSPVTIDGQFLHYSIIYDITDKKHVEDELRNLYRAVEQSPSTVVITDIDGYIQYVNPNFTKITGYSKEEAVGEHSRLLKSGIQGDEIYKDLWDTITSGKVWNGVFSNKKKDGSIYWESALIAPVKDEYGKVTRYIKVGEDITQRMKAEEDLKKSYETFATVMNSMNIGIYAVDIETHKVVFSNSYVRKLIGNVMGKVCCDVFSKMGENSCKLCNNRRLLDKKGNPTGEIQWDYPREINGKWYTMRDKAIPWIDGRMVRLSIMTDITKNRMAEEELLRSNQELDMFAHRISHDLKNPLSVVISYIRIIQKEYLSDNDDEAQKITGEVADRTQRMVNMIDNLLSYSEVSAEDNMFSELDTNTALNDAIENLELQIGESKARISKDNLPILVGDETQLTSVFQNLISNAIKYRKVGIVPQIHISSEDKGDEWLFSVKDNGIGIPEADQRSIFFIFHRLHKNQEEFSGNGIGLTSCKKVVERHKGQIWVESSLGEGSTFFFTISKSLDKKQPSD